MWGWEADREEGLIPRREQDDQEASAGGRKATGNRDTMTGPFSWSLRITGRIPGCVPGRESGLTWSGELWRERSR
jgi:hypothetical protein